jgi:predicted  nucleic acid-binding Zn-ribbon protein
MDGDPYLDDPELADLFAFLLATNETRTAVLTEQDLREVIMRPVDMAAIKREIESLEDEKFQVDEELEELSAVQQQLPELEGERADLTERIEETEAELAAKREELADAEASVDESREEKRAVDEKMSELGDVRSDLESVRQELRAQRESLDSLQADRDELAADESELPDAPAGEIEEIDAQIDELRAEKQSLQSELNTLQRIIQFNEDNLESAGGNVLEDLVEIALEDLDLEHLGVVGALGGDAVDVDLAGGIQLAGRVEPARVVDQPSQRPIAKRRAAQNIARGRGDQRAVVEDMRRLGVETLGDRERHARVGPAGTHRQAHACLARAIGRRPNRVIDAAGRADQCAVDIE